MADEDADASRATAEVSEPQAALAAGRVELSPPIVPPPPPQHKPLRHNFAGKEEEEAQVETKRAPEDELWVPPQQVSEAEVCKWNEMMGRREDGTDDGMSISQYMRMHPDRFARRVRRGIPPQFRWEVWKAAVHLHEHEHIIAQDYRSLCVKQNQWTSVIQIDIGRTFPELKSFAQDQQEMLWRVLNAYASYNPQLGYCQGMNFVAGLLLLVSNFQEEESFGVLVCLMDNVGLAGFYGEKLPLFKRYLRACDMLVKETVPDLREHFKKENVNAPVYLHQWFLTLFINCFPLSMVTIIWDVIICEGLEVVLRIAVSILQVLKDSLLAMQFEEIIKFFKMMKTYDDEDGELNAFRIGQLLMKHTELVKVPQNILDLLRSDEADDDPFEADEAWEADGGNAATWLAGFGRVLSGFNMFNYGSTKRRGAAPGSGVNRSSSDISISSSTPTMRTAESAAHRAQPSAGTFDASPAGMMHSVEPEEEPAMSAEALKQNSADSAPANSTNASGAGGVSSPASGPNRTAQSDQTRDETLTHGWEFL